MLSTLNVKNSFTSLKIDQTNHRVLSELRTLLTMANGLAVVMDLFYSFKTFALIGYVLF